MPSSDQDKINGSTKYLELGYDGYDIFNAMQSLVTRLVSAYLWRAVVYES